MFPPLNQQNQLPNLCLNFQRISLVFCLPICLFVFLEILPLPTVVMSLPVRHQSLAIGNLKIRPFKSALINSNAISERQMIVCNKVLNS